jgi:hypothetical protein
MLIDRHRVAALLDLSRIAGSSEAERVASQPALETLLVALYAAATPTARERFTQRIERLPASGAPSGATPQVSSRSARRSRPSCISSSASATTTPTPPKMATASPIET